MAGKRILNLWIDNNEPPLTNVVWIRPSWGMFYYSEGMWIPIIDVDKLIQELLNEINEIESIIPSEVDIDNKLVDKNYVDTNISTASATFRGTSATGLTELQFLTWANSLTKDKNDYVFWNTVDSDSDEVYKCYKWDDVQWNYEFTLSNTDKAILYKELTLTNQQRNIALANVSNLTADANTGKMGYKVLKPYDEEDASTAFAEQINNLPNTIFEIRDVFDLGGTQEVPVNITMPSGSILKFNGGAIKNCTIIGDNTKLEGNVKFNTNVFFQGNFIVEKVSPIWFGGYRQLDVNSSSKYTNSEDLAPYFNKAVELVYCSNGELYIPEGCFVIKSPITWVGNRVRIRGANPRTSIILFGKPTDQNQTSPIVFEFTSGEKTGYIRDIRFESKTSYGYNGVFSKGIILNNLYFSGGIIENVRVYRCGIFIKGQIYSVSKIVNCSFTGLGYSLISRVNEDDYETFDGRGNILMDSIIDNCYINSVNAFGARLTYNRCMLNGGVSTSIISNNYIDFWKYIVTSVTSGDNDMSAHVFSNRFENNIFDLCFSFCWRKGGFYLNRTIIQGNTIQKCSWSSASSTAWGDYALSDTDVNGTKWIFFDNVIPQYSKIIGNSIDPSCNKILRLASSANNVDFLTDIDIERYLVPPSSEMYGYNKSYSGDKDLYIGKNLILYNYTLSSSNNGRRYNYYNITSTIPYSFSSRNSYGYYDFGNSYYRLEFPSRRYGKLMNCEVKEWMADLGCLNYEGEEIVSEIYTIDGVEKTFVVSKYNSKITGCFSKDFKTLFDNNLFIIANSNHHVKIFDIGIDVYFTSSSDTNGLVRRNLLYSSSNLYNQGFPILLIMSSDPTESNSYIGRIYYNKTDDKFRIYGYNGWVDYSGYIPLRNYGTTKQRPINIYHNRYLRQGLQYYDTDLNKTIMWNGTDWINLDGSSLTKYSINTEGVIGFTINNNITDVEASKSYVVTLTPNDGYSIITPIVVTMGGVDVTSNYFNSSTGVIAIMNVNGNVVITGEAELQQI